MPRADPPAANTNAVEDYRRRCEEVERDRASVARRSRRISNLRLVLFLSFVGILAWIEAVGTNPGPRLVAAAVIVVAFVILVVFHRRVRRQIQWLDAMEAVNRDAIDRVNRDWDALPLDTQWQPDAEHPYAVDLDIFGRASVFQLLGSVRSAPGKRTLATWLLEPASKDEVAQRQESVLDLAPRIDLRQRFEVAARLSSTPSVKALEQFLDWAEGGPFLAGHVGLVWLTRLLAVITVVLLGLHIGGVIPYAFWLIPLLLNAGITARFRRPIHDTFKRASANESSFRAYSAMLQLLEEADVSSEKLRDAQDSVAHEGLVAHRELHRLHNIIALADVRLSMLYPVFQGLVLWDVQVLDALERWQRRCGKLTRGWLRALGEFEALNALGGLAHDNPEWAMPDLTSVSGPLLQAESLGHPLLPVEGRVDNDVEIGPSGTFLLVTGSNMSGKSTLLRAVGVNAVLAQAGGPVCASRFSLPPCRVFTSMRVTDSLSDGVSYFMAGLRRLKQVVDAAKDDSSGEPLLYLLDEILQGTNTAERMVAVRGIIAELLEQGSIGAVTTHDLALADAPELLESRVAVHFTESIGAGGGGETMTFDYKLKPGVATSRNALRLMELMGLRDVAAADTPTTQP